MQPVSYSFLDVAILDEVRERFAAGDALAILSTDLEQVIWANGPGAALFGYADIVAAMGASPQLGFATRRQIAATSGFPAIGRDRTIMVRMTTGMTSRAVMFQASAVTLPDGETAILLASPAATGGARSDREIAARAISGFNEAGHFVAFVDGQGGIEAASPGFDELGISTETMAALTARLASGTSRIAKRMVPGRGRALPAGMVRLTDNRHLVVVIDEGDPAESMPAAVAATEPAPAAEPAQPVELALGTESPIEPTIPDARDTTPVEAARIDPEDSTATEPVSTADAVADSEPAQPAAASTEAAASAVEVTGDEAAAAEQEAITGSAPYVVATSEEVGGADAAAEQLADAVAGHEAFDPAEEPAAEGGDAIAEQAEAPATADSKSDHDSWYFSRAEDASHASLPSDAAPAEETPADAASNTGDTVAAQSIAAKADEPADEIAPTAIEAIEADAVPAGLVAAVDESAPAEAVTAETADDEPTEVAASEPAEAAAREPVEVAAAAIAPKIDRASAPVRFVWRTDSEGKFSQISPEFGGVVGAAAADVIGRRFQDVADTFALDPSGEIGGLLARRDTWSGRSVLWPVAGTDLKVPVDLAALPIYGRERNFEGFRGFGVARAADAVVDPEGIGLALVPGPSTAADTAASSPSPVAANDAAKAADPFRGEVPALTIVPQPDRRFADKVIRLAEHRQPANDKGLSAGERIAFQQIGERLKKESGPEAPVQPPTEAAPVASAEPDATPPADVAQPEVTAETASHAAGPHAQAGELVAAAEDQDLGPIEAEVEGEDVAALLAIDGADSDEAETLAGETEEELKTEAEVAESADPGSRPISPLAGEMSPLATEGGAVPPASPTDTVPPSSPHDDEAGHSTLPPSVLPDISPARGEIGQSPDDDVAEKAEAEPVVGSRPISPLVGEMSPLATEGGAVPPPSPQDIEAGHSTLPPSVLPDISPARGEIGQSPKETVAAETRPVKPARSGMSLLDFAKWDQDDEAAAAEITQPEAEAETTHADQAATAEIASTPEAIQAAADMPAATDAEIRDEPVAEAVDMPAAAVTGPPTEAVAAAEAGLVEPDAAAVDETAGEPPAGQAVEAVEPAATEADAAATGQAEAPASANEELAPEMPADRSTVGAQADLAVVAEAPGETAPAARAADAAPAEAPPARPLPANDTLPPAEVAPAAAEVPAEAWRAVPPPLKAAGFVPSALASAVTPKRSDTSILEKLPVPVLVHAGDALHYANAEFFAFTGYGSVEELADAGGIGALFVDPYGDEEQPERSDRQLRLRDRAGAEFPVEAFLQSVPWNGSKALLLVLAKASDKSLGAASAGQSPLIAELEARVAEMRTIIDTATDGVVLISRDGTIRSISRPAEALFGFDSDDVTGKPFASLFAIESQRAARDYLNGLTDHGVASVLNDGREVIGREAEGRFIPLFMTIGKLPADSGYCAVVRDITQWKRAEEELTQARAVAERASSHKTDFLARISHEIRTPLNAIIGFSELMVDEKFGPVANDRYRDYLRDINRSGNHVLDLVNDLLDISKIEAGQQEMAYEAVSLNDTLAETVAMMQPQANRERVIIRSSFASKLPDVVADLRSVRQIALNILSNAVRYTQAGGQVIVSTAYEVSGDVVMRVRDTGIGMSQAEIEQALKPFKQINSLKRARGDGTGLGLPLTKAMVEANRARFTINSTPGEGTLVEISFPSTRVLAE